MTTVPSAALPAGGLRRSGITRAGVLLSTILMLVAGLLWAPAASAAPAPTQVVVASSAMAPRFGSPVLISFTLSAGGVSTAGRVAHISWQTGGRGAYDVRTDSRGRGVLKIAAGKLPMGRTVITVTPRAPLAGRGTVAVTVMPRNTSTNVPAARTTYGTSARIMAKVVLTGYILPAGGNAKVDIDGRTVSLVPVPRTGTVRLTLPWSPAVGRHVVGLTYFPARGSIANRSRGTAWLTVVRVAPRWSVAVPGRQPAFGSIASVVLSLNAPHAVARGSVILRDGATVLGVAALRGHATVSFRVRVDPSMRTLTATSSGDATVGPSRTVFRLGVVRAVPVITVSPAAATAGASSVVRVTVRGAVTVPGGAVTVFVDGRAAAAGELLDGSATLSLPQWSAGSHTIFARYSGDIRFTPRLSGKQAITATTNPCPPSARACVDLTHQQTWLQSGGRITYGPVSITSGRAGYRTYSGSFQVYWKDANHHSSEFNNAPMPNSVFFDGGIAFHAGSLSVQSHGCVHLSYEASQVYFDSLSVGDQVFVFGSAPY